MGMTRRDALSGGLGGCVASLATRAVSAQPSEAPIYLKNGLIFDGSGAPAFSGSVLIDGGKIRGVAAGSPDAPANAKIVDCTGNFVMPGLTDAHWHMTLATGELADFRKADLGLVYAHAVAEAHNVLMRGFTTVRDVAGPVFGLKQAIDSGVIPGPRIFPSGALISQTGGHGDFGAAFERPTTLGGQPDYLQLTGLEEIANGPAEVRAAAREQFRKGASQIKLAVGGGVFSEFDPVDSLQFSPEEIRAAVECADDWGSYVAVHVYTVAGIRRALDAGVRSIEHGLLADEATLALMARQQAWLSLQPFEHGDGPLTPAQEAKIQSSGLEGTWEGVLRTAKKVGTKVAFGTDVLFMPAGNPRENVMLTRFSRVFSNAETLRIATSGNCELFALSGKRNNYRDAALGLLKPGAWADLLVVRGNPLNDIDLLIDYDRNFLAIIKDGNIVKSLLAANR